MEAAAAVVVVVEEEEEEEEEERAPEWLARPWVREVGPPSRFAA